MSRGRLFLWTGISCFLASVLTMGCSQAPSCSSTPAVVSTQPAAPAHNFDKWEKEISAYEAQDRANPPAKGGILFIGSSTVRLWKSLAQDFPDHHVINRGFGGSEIVDSTRFAERIIFPYEPKMVFLRAGTNDIHAGKSAESVFEDYKAFVAKVHARLPRTKIVFISLAPAPSRWAERDANKTLNTLVEKFSRGKSYLKYVETYNMSIDAAGQPRKELFVADQLHFNADGYRLLAGYVRPFLPK